LKKTTVSKERGNEPGGKPQRSGRGESVPWVSRKFIIGEKATRGGDGQWGPCDGKHRGRGRKIQGGGAINLTGGKRKEEQG